MLNIKLAIAHFWYIITVEIVFVLAVIIIEDICNGYMANSINSNIVFSCFNLYMHGLGE